MYDVDDLDEVVEIGDMPHPDSGAPSPQILADERHLILAYFVSEPPRNWDAVDPDNVSNGLKGELIAIVRFRRARTHMFGPPNDEALHGHPLFKRGLSYYAAHEVKHSSWLRRLERMNSVHPNHDKDRYLADKRHYVFTFHDSTFECIANAYSCETFRGSMSDAWSKMIAMAQD